MGDGFRVKEGWYGPCLISRGRKRCIGSSDEPENGRRSSHALFEARTSEIGYGSYESPHNDPRARAKFRLDKIHWVMGDRYGMIDMGENEDVPSPATSVTLPKILEASWR